MSPGIWHGDQYLHSWWAPVILRQFIALGEGRKQGFVNHVLAVSAYALSLDAPAAFGLQYAFL